MSTALHSPDSTAATAAMPSAASDTVNPLRSSARRISRREPASSSTMSTWIGTEEFGTSGNLGVVERFELGEGDGTLRAQLRDGGGQVGDIPAARRVFDLPRDGRNVGGAEVGAGTLQRVGRARDVFGVAYLECVLHVGEQLR